MDISEERKAIDAVDSEIAELFIKRMASVKAIALQKKEAGEKVVDSAREKLIFDEMKKLFPQELSLYGKELFEKLIELSKKYQKDIIFGE